MVRHSFILELRRYTEQDPCYGAMVLWSTLYPHIAHPFFADVAGYEVKPTPSASSIPAVLSTTYWQADISLVSN